MVLVRVAARMARDDAVESGRSTAARLWREAVNIALGTQPRRGQLPTQPPRRDHEVRMRASASTFNA